MIKVFIYSWFSLKCQGEKAFRDKLTPIVITLSFSLDPQAPVDSHGLQPILNYQTKQLIEQKVPDPLLQCINQRALLTESCLRHNGHNK